MATPHNIKYELLGMEVEDVVERPEDFLPALQQTLGVAPVLRQFDGFSVGLSEAYPRHGQTIDVLAKDIFEGQVRAAVLSNDGSRACMCLIRPNKGELADLFRFLS